MAGTALRIRFLAGVVLGLGLIPPSQLLAQDFIIHANGDSINGDVKGFERGKLEFEIPGATATFIEFDDISTIGSPDLWQIELDDQTRVLGTLEPGTAPRTVRIMSDMGTRQVPLARVFTRLTRRTSRRVRYTWSFHLRTSRLLSRRHSIADPDPLKERQPP